MASRTAGSATAPSSVLHEGHSWHVGAELDRLVVSSLGGWSLVIGDVDAVGAPLRYPKLAS